VIVGNFVVRGPAEALKQKALAIKAIDDAFLDPYPDRQP
jgi:hypothetical protein